MYRITHQYLTLADDGNETPVVSQEEETVEDWTGIPPIIDRMLRFPTDGSITTISISINLTQTTWI